MTRERCNERGGRLRFESARRLVSAPYLLDEAAAKAYHDGIEQPPRRRPPRGIHDDKDAARKAGFVAPIAGGEQTIAVIAQFLADNFGMRFIRGGRIEVSLTKPVLFGDTLDLARENYFRRSEYESRRAADSRRQSARRTGADGHRRSQDGRRMSAGTIPGSTAAPRDDVPGGSRDTAVAQGASVSRDRRDLCADLLAHPGSQSRAGAVAGADTRVPGGVHAVLAVLLRDRFGLPDLGGASLQRADATTATSCRFARACTCWR